MKKITALTLVFALLAGCLSGCGAGGAQEEPIKKPPALTILDAKKEAVMELHAAGFSWTWPLKNGQISGVEADAISPLDEAVLELDELWFFPDEDAVYTLSFPREPSRVNYVRWDMGQVGDYAAMPEDSETLEAPWKMCLVANSVYMIQAVFDQVDGEGGNADYYLITGATEKEYETPELFPGQTEDYYWQTKEYADHQNAIRRSQEIRGGMDAYYSKILPLLLNGRENCVCSPLNLYLALSMLAEAAGGESREAVLRALNAPDLETVRANAALLLAANDFAFGSTRSMLANSLWMNDAVPCREETLSALREYHKAEARSGVMGSPELDQQLRDWINEKTGELLKEFVAGLHTQPETVMELISTVYFKASWTDKFYSENTDTAVFHGLHGDAECDMMHRTASASYYTGKSFSAVSLGLNEGGSMYFILPNEDVLLSRVIADPQVSALLRGSLEAQYPLVDMSIPKFDVKSDTDLTSAMTAMGMGALFDMDAADFSALTDAEPVYLSQAEHAAGVTVDEEGVTGAAYTVFAIALGAAPPSEIVPFVLDRPFLFAVAARDGSVLFAGTVTDF